MLEIFGPILSFLLIFIVFLRTPEDSLGLSSFTVKTNLLSSPGSTRRLLDFLTATEAILYLIIAFKLNIMNN